MEKAFVYGVSVENENFTDRVKEIMDTYNLGTKSNFTRIKNTLIEKELIEERKDGLYLSDPIFRIWFNSNYNDL